MLVVNDFAALNRLSQPTFAMRRRDYRSAADEAVHRVISPVFSFLR
jgi:hypothetical protein